PPSTHNGTEAAIRDLARVSMVITGSNLASYHPLLSQSVVESTAIRDGFHVVRVWLVGQHQSILVWRRGATAPRVPAPSPVTKMLLPLDGSNLKRGVVFVASGSDRVFAISRVEFTISGAGRRISVPAVQFQY